MKLAKKQPKRSLPKLVLGSALGLLILLLVAYGSEQAAGVCCAINSSDSMDDAVSPVPRRTSYTEDLTLQRLGDHHVAARFVFRSMWVPQARHRCQDHENWSSSWQGEDEEEGGAQETAGGGGELCHFEAVFPRAVGVLLDRFKASCSLGVPEGGAVRSPGTAVDPYCCTFAFSFICFFNCCLLIVMSTLLRIIV